MITILLIILYAIGIIATMPFAMLILGGIFGFNNTWINFTFSLFWPFTVPVTIVYIYLK